MLHKKNNQEEPTTTSNNIFQDALRYKEWNIDTLTQANTVEGADYLSVEEKRVFILCNLARLNGKLFAKTFLKDYIKKETANTKSLAAELNALPQLRMLKPIAELHDSALGHAQDLGSHGLTSHDSSDGTSMSDRIWGYIDADTVGENCSFGLKNPLDIVLSLLIDEGVAGLGHRRNLLSPTFEYMGVSIASHAAYKVDCVQDFAGGLA